MARRVGFLLLLVLAGCRACSSSSDAAGVANAAGAGGEGGPSGWAPLRVESFERGAMATALPDSCVRGATEVCNAIDDDCSGTIDSGCGYGTGQLQITTAWDAPVDIDLYVTVPTGDIVSYQSPTTFDGGLLDRTSRGRCESPSIVFDTPPAGASTAGSAGAALPDGGTAVDASATNGGTGSEPRPAGDAPRSASNIENFVYTSRPPLGHYVVELHYWGECMSAAGAVDVVVGVSVGGSFIGGQRVTLTPNEREVAVSFDVR